MKTQVTIEIGGQELRVDIDYTPLVPAKTDGPPENCYPEEGGEIEIELVYLFAGLCEKTPRFIDITDLLAEMDASLQLIMEKVQEEQDFGNDEESSDD